MNKKNKFQVFAKSPPESSSGNIPLFRALEGYYNDCFLTVEFDGREVFEGLYRNDYFLGTVLSSGEGTVSYGTLPPFFSGTPSPIQLPGYTSVDFYIPAGTNLDFESLSSLAPSLVQQLRGNDYFSIVYTDHATIGPDCVVDWTFTVHDVNDELEVFSPPSSETLCKGAIKTVIFYVIDRDVSPSFRNIDISFANTFNGLIDNISRTSFQAEQNVQEAVSFRINTANADPGLYEISLTVTDGRNTIVSDFNISVVGAEFWGSQAINLISFVPSGTQNNATLAHIFVPNTQDYYDNGFDCTFGNCVGDSLFIWNNNPTTGLYYNSNSSEAATYTISIEAYNMGAATVGDRITGSATANLIGNDSDSDDNFTCCGFYSVNLGDEYPIFVGPPLEPFNTGIGPNIPFSGGVGSYLEPFGTKKIIVAPQTSEIALSSNEDYFYIYTAGEKDVSGIKHPVHTGLIEVVGSYGINFVGGAVDSEPESIICRYDSSSGNNFFVYNVVSGSFTYTGVPFSSDIKRIVRLDRHRRPSTYFIVGSGEYVVYNAESNHFTEISGLPITLSENIALIPEIKANCSTSSAEEDRFGNFTNKYHLFALNHHYDETSDYPIKLNLNENILEDGVSIVGSFGRTYLNSYANYRTDVVSVADRLLVSLSNTGDLTSQLIISNVSTAQKYTINNSSHESRRLSVLTNAEVLWCSADVTGNQSVIDPFLNSSRSVDITGNISVVASNHIEYRSLLLDASGTKAYLMNDLDRTYEEISFTGNLPMDKYGDIIVFDKLSSDNNQSHNFYLSPTAFYNTGFPSGRLIALSPNTVGATGINIAGNFTIDETVISFEPVQTTTELTEIGRFTLEDDEFSGGVNIGFDTNLGDGDIFEASVTNDSGIIYVKSGEALDYETKNKHTGYITGIDPYAGGVPFIDTFVLTVLNVDEKPTGITIDPPNSGSFSINASLTSNVQVATFSVADPDSENNNNVITVAGPDRSIFTTTFDNDSQQGILYIKAGTVFDAEVKDTYDITLLAAKNGENFTASSDWKLEIFDNPPVSVVIGPTSISLPENYIIPTTGLRLARFELVDTDSNKGNFVELIGADANYFSVSYDLPSNSGTLTLIPGNAFDFETQTSVIAQIGAGNVNDDYSATGIFTINVIDVLEPSGLTFTPGIVYVDETTGNPTQTVLSTISFTDEENQGEIVTITDLHYTTGGFRSALNLFSVNDNQTDSPHFVFLDDIALDYETQSIYYIVASGYPGTQTSNVLGGLITVVVNDIDEPPTITFNPSESSIRETTPTHLQNIKLADIFVQDESQSTVSLTLTGVDSSYFTIVPSSVLIDDPSNSLVLGELYFKTGVQLNFGTKNLYSAQVVATDFNGSKSTGIFNLNITDVDDCFVEISGNGYDVLCPEDTDGYILVDMRYTGDGANICSFDQPLSLSWQNLPSGITAVGNGSSVYGLGTGTYTAYLLGGTIPITSVSFDINSSTPMQITTVSINQKPCDATGFITISFTGGKPPHFIDYAGNISEIPSGSALVSTISINTPTSGNITIRDGNNCSFSDGPYTFSFPSNPSYTFNSQTAPLIYDDVLSSYLFDVSHDKGPYQINIYESTTGEKGELLTAIDSYDTSVLVGIEQIGQNVLDSSGNVQVLLSADLFNNPLVYKYDIGHKIYPGLYVFEFINQNGCSFTTDLQTASNIQPLEAIVSSTTDASFDLGINVLSQPILDTLFIPYRLIVKDSSVLSYISNITEKSDIRLQIGNKIFDRKSLYGSIYCETYSIINIKFLGLKSNEWYFTIPFYKGFDLSDISEVDILNEDIYLVISENKKIKVVTELNNNTNTIKLLKGSLLTTDEQISQFKINAQIELNELLINGTFENLAEAKVAQTYTLHNKHIPGNIFMVDFLHNSDISQNLNSNALDEVIFDCKTNQSIINNYKQFIINLNNFNNYENIYFKTKNNLQHNGFINLIISGGYANEDGSYIVSYKYYDLENKKILNLIRNNEIVKNENVLDNVKSGSYIIKATDKEGNKLQTVNDISYDSFFSKMIDFIINDLHTTKEALGFEYGDLIINVYDGNIYVNSTPPIIPGTEPEISDPGNPVPPVVITTSTHKVSPNTSYTNKVTIQTDPAKVKFVVTGPYGYHKIFEDKVELIQLPPGVYNIEGYSTELHNKYLYQDKRKLFVNSSTNILVDLSFQLYRDVLIIDKNNSQT